MSVSLYQLNSEQAVLGAILESAWAWQREREWAEPALAMLEPRDFATAAHGAIWKGIQAVVAAGNPPNLVFVDDELKKSDNVRLDPGPAYLAELGEAYWTERHYITNHARAIRTAALHRRLAEAAERRDDDAIREATQALTALGVVESGDEFPTMREVADKYFDMIGDESTSVVRVGIGGLDRTTGGFRPGNLVTVAARPAVGKSALGITMAYNVAVRQHIPVGFISLEMSTYEITQRLLAIDAGVSTQEARQMSDAVATALGRISEEPLYIRRPGSRLSDVLAACGPLVSQYGCKLVIIDYLQLMSAGQSDSRPQDIAVITRELKNWAVSNEVAVVALAQLKRDTAGIPKLEDLAEGDAPARDSDVVLLLHPDESTTVQASQPVDLIIAKHRNGPTGIVSMQFIRKSTRFLETEWSR